MFWLIKRVLFLCETYCLATSMIQPLCVFLVFFSSSIHAHMGSLNTQRMGRWRIGDLTGIEDSYYLKVAVQNWVAIWDTMGCFVLVCPCLLNIGGYIFGVQITPWLGRLEASTKAIPSCSSKTNQGISLVKPIMLLLGTTMSSLSDASW